MHVNKSADTYLISLAISSSVSRLLLSMNMRNSTMATSPTIDPNVAAATIPALEAVAQITDQYSHFMGFKDALLKNKSSVVGSCVRACVYAQGGYVQVITSRLMEQLSEPAVLLARQMYFPDMLLVRLLSLRVPCLSSAEQPHSYTRHKHIFM